MEARGLGQKGLRSWPDCQTATIDRIFIIFRLGINREPEDVYTYIDVDIAYPRRKEVLPLNEAG